MYTHSFIQLWDFTTPSHRPIYTHSSTQLWDYTTPSLRQIYTHSSTQLRDFTTLSLRPIYTHSSKQLWDFTTPALCRNIEKILLHMQLGDFTTHSLRPISYVVHRFFHTSLFISVTFVKLKTQLPVLLIILCLLKSKIVSRSAGRQLRRTRLNIFILENKILSVKIK